MIAVREFTSADEQMAFYKAMKARQRASLEKPAPVVLPFLAREPEPAPEHAPAILPVRPRFYKREGVNIYAWPIGPRHCRDVLYVATPVVEGGIQEAISIINDVARKHGFSLAVLKSPRRDKGLVLARHECFYRLKEKTGLSFPHIGKIMGNRDHTTVLHGVKRYARLLAEGVVAL